MLVENQKLNSKDVQDNSKKAIIVGILWDFIKSIALSQVLIIPISIWVGSFWEILNFGRTLTGIESYPILVFWILINTLIIPATILIISLAVSLWKKEKYVLFVGMIVSIVMFSLGLFSLLLIDSYK